MVYQTKVKDCSRVENWKSIHKNTFPSKWEKILGLVYNALFIEKHHANCEEMKITKKSKLLFLPKIPEV